MHWILRNGREQAQWAGSWDRVIQRSAQSPLLTRQFVSCLIEHTIAERAWVAIAMDGMEPVAAAVLTVSWPGIWHTLQPSQAPVALWLQDPQIGIERLLDALHRSLPGPVAMIGISQLDPDMVARPFTSDRLVVLDYIDTPRITVHTSFDEYWNNRGKNLRSNMRRQRIRLLGQGNNLKLETVTRPEHVGDAVRQYGMLESSGWKAAQGTAVHAENAQGRFYRALMESACAAGLGRIYRYWYGNRLAAMDICVASGDTLVVLKTAYDESIEGSSPASLMRQEYMREVFDSGTIKRIEFYGRAMEWHLRWTDELRRMYHINFYRSKSMGKLHRWSQRMAKGKVMMLQSPDATPDSRGLVRSQNWQIMAIRRFDECKQGLASLAARFPATPFFKAQFIEDLIEAFSSGDEVIAVQGDRNDPIAFGIFERKALGTWSTFQPSQSPKGVWMHAPDDQRGMEEHLTGLMRALPGLPLLVSVTQKDSYLHARPTPTRRMRVVDYISIGTIWMRQSYAAYYAERPKHVRTEVERRLRRLAQEGVSPRLEIVTDPGRMHECVRQFGDLETKGWKGREGTAVHIDNAQGRFYAQMMEHVALSGDAIVYRYWFGETLAAVQLALSAGDMLVMLKTTYDESLKSFGPGILMKHALFASAFDSGKWKRIEFYGHLQPWQEKWCNEVRTLYHVNLYRWAWLATAADMWKDFRLRVPMKFKQPHDSTGKAGARPVTVVERIDDLPANAVAIFRRAEKTCVFFGVDWYRILADQILARFDRLRIYTVSGTASDHTAAILPMRYRDGLWQQISGRTLEPLANYYSPVFAPLFASADGHEELIEALVQGIRGDRISWSIVDFHSLDRDSPAFTALCKALQRHGYWIQTYFCAGNWYLEVNGRSFEQFFAGLPTRVRQTVQRKRKLLDAEGRLTLHMYRESNEIEEGLAAYEQVYALSWKRKEPYPEFIREVVRQWTRQSQLRLGIARVNDVPVAAQIWVVNGKTACIYKLAYDDRFAKASVGSILTAHMMRHAIDHDKVQTVDYLVGDETYKRDWMSHRRERWGVRAFDARSPRGLAGAVRHIGGQLVKGALGRSKLLLGQGQTKKVMI